MPNINKQNYYENFFSTLNTKGIGEMSLKRWNVSFKADVPSDPPHSENIAGGAHGHDCPDLVAGIPYRGGDYV
jgi:hypothetical protein